MAKVSSKSCMGADAYIFEFDHEIYRTSVVPTFLKLLSEGTWEPWLAELQASYAREWCLEEAEFNIPARIALAAHCTHLSDELANREVPWRERSLYECGWKDRACRSSTCDIRSRCPFHVDNNSAIADNLQRLFRLSVERRCLGRRQFLGRSVDCYFYWKTLDTLGVLGNDPIRELLSLLGRRAFLIGYAFSATEGIHGWLTTVEAQDLSQRLFALDLPEYEYSFAAMQSFIRAANILEGTPVDFTFELPAFDHPSRPFEELSLSYVRTVCSIAANNGKGVLWGNAIGC